MRLLLLLLVPALLSARELVLNLEEVVRIAQEKNIESIKSELDLKKVEEQIREVRGAIFPSLKLSATYTRWDPDYISAFIPENQYFISLQLTQTIFNKSVFEALRVAQRTRDLQRAVREDVKRSLSAEAKKLYWGVLFRREILKIRQESMRYLEGYFELVKERYDKGIVPRFEFLRARAQLRRARADLIRAESDYRRAVSSLKTFLGIEGDVRVDGELEPVPFKVSDPEGMLLKNNSTLKVISKTIKARETAVDLKVAEYYPQLNAFANYDVRNIIDFQAGRLVEEQRRGYSFGLRLDFVLFDGFGRSARTAQERIELEKVRRELEFTRKKLLGDLNSLLAELKSIREEISASKDSIESERLAMEFAEERYREGIGDQIDLLTARRSYEGALISYYSAVLSHNTVVADLERLVR